MRSSDKKENAIVTKKYIVDQIYNRLDGAISKRKLTVAIGAIVDELEEMLLNKEQIAIKNFGILDPYLQHGHKGINVFSGNMDYHDPVWRVKFLTSHALKRILVDNLENFDNS